MKFRFTLLFLCLAAVVGAQTVFSGPISCGSVRYYSLENVAIAMWSQLNDTTGELSFYDLKRKQGCLVSVEINPDAEPVYIGTSELFNKVIIDLSNREKLKLKIQEKVGSIATELYLNTTHSSLAVPLDYQCFNAVRAIYFDTETGRDSVTLTIDHLYPVPAREIPEADSLRFVKAMLSMYDGMTVDAVYPDDNIKNFDIQYIQDYTSMFESGEAEIDDVFSTWTIYDEVSVLFQKNNLIGFVSAGYEYTGGAHGLYGTVNYVYDFTSEKLITLEDLFGMNYEAELEAAINFQMKADMNLTADASLADEGFFVEVVPVTPNFMLSETDLSFQYNIYEIAPYVFGSITVSVPYSALSSLIPAGGVIERMME